MPMLTVLVFERKPDYPPLASNVANFARLSSSLESLGLQVIVK